MKRRKFLQNAGMLSLSPLVLPPISADTPPASHPHAINTRKLWLNYLEKLATPVLTALAADQLKEKMPVETATPSQVKDRAKYSHLEAFGRLLSGIAPWLQADHLDAEEKRLHDKYFQLSIKSISNAVNPTAKDYMNWGDEGGQPLVDASFFAYALIRCPKLWQRLDSGTQQMVILALRKTHVIKPPENNWLLFAAMIEAFFITINEPFDAERIKYAVNRHEEWYKGDGMYGDGPEFHWDYYNSFVIHPFLYAILKIVSAKDPSYEPIRAKVLEHNLRYAIIQERLITDDGGYPIIGRSITYRTGAFHHLANMAFRQQLPAQLKPVQVRCGLTAVINKFTETGDIFDNEGWLRIGLYGHQPSLAEGYISTGSLYLSSAILLPLGLPESDPFWNAPDEDWTARKLTAGIDLPADHSS
ncbi:DUF2264 domain-containing protein [Mucilaginibacter gotjawali]|uniref:Uncharacterized protein n=2 Tax=Mucilaginibacter gotjawali TaxID=1550579 RepID=A0A839SBE7_9SPHI|nr:DUF2264 domain-containing protein [Mucilaginibacter gotjawali]MBB3053969.1 hypothetical protein [Mucilaginibacter gotjawali]BAU54234.1 hypothetical protein MgSA37_02408 [Mucilaginibacter gotjawali]